MDLLIQGQYHAFNAVRAFRAEYGLPDAFGMALVAPKDFTGLGSIQRAGAELNILREEILNSIPTQPPANGWRACALELQLRFRRKLDRINPAIGLSESEITYAAAGFGEVCQLLVESTLQARMQAGLSVAMRHNPEDLYATWLNSTVQLSHETYPYVHHGEPWAIRLVWHAYGRAGLIVNAGDAVHYVHDPSLGCPAEGFMAALLRDTGTRILATMAGSYRPSPPSHSAFPFETNYEMKVE